MSRAEPARSLDNSESDRTGGTSTAASDRRERAAAAAGLSILLLAKGEAASETNAALQHSFGDQCHCECVGDAAEAIEIMQRDEPDICLFAEDASFGDPAAIVRSAIEAECETPIVVIAHNANTDTDLKMVDAGAADCIPADELTTTSLERSIRHALLRQHGAARAQREINHLTTEIGRLNTLRDANHRFVDNACHDFRSPLTVIKEFSSIISEGLAGDVNEEQAEFLEIILTRVDQLSSMVDAILDASRLESDLIGVKREQHAVAELVQPVRPTLEQAASGAGAEIHFAIADNLPAVFADAESVGRIIVNLATNACKFAGEGGKVEVWARHEPGSSEVSIGVTDNGPGIAQEHVKRIFDRFQQIENDSEIQAGGFGLGLHIASELVRVNYGTLSVESEPKKGSTFVFTLPVFDVNALIPLHFRFLRTSRHGFQNVSIAMATTGEDAAADATAQMDQFLNRQLRSYDLLLRLNPASWLVCIACDEGDLTKIIDRVKLSYSSHNSNRPNGALPNLNFRNVGTWGLSNRPEGLTAAIRSAYALGPKAADQMH